MTLLSAFVARSFDSRDEPKIAPVLEFLDGFKRAGFIWETAEAAEVESVSKKVRRLIDEKNAFVGFFTRRSRVLPHPFGFTSAVRLLFGGTTTQSWSAPPWVLQESGYAIRADKKLILLKEDGVDLPGLQGDLEYIPFDPRNLAPTFAKLNEMINALLAEESGRTVTISISEREEKTPTPMPEAAAQIALDVAGSPESEKVEEPDIPERYWQMAEAAENHDLAALSDAWVAGSKLVDEPGAQGMDQISWDGLYFEKRFEAGANDALADLRELRSRNPDRFEPVMCIARCYQVSGEPDTAASLFLEAAAIANGSKKSRPLLSAARALREAKDYDRALDVVRECTSLAPEDVKDEAISLRYDLLKDRGETHMAMAMAEAALHENPQISIRFALGLDYRRLGLKELAFYHFKILHDRNQSESGSLHNLALLSDDCEMPIAAVQRYKTAFSFGETLSAANLAYLYLSRGFAKEAIELLSEATRAADHVTAVDRCVADIKQRREDEAEKEVQVLKAAGETRTFFLEFGRALSTPMPTIDGIWRFPFGSLPLSLTSGRLFGSADVQAKTHALLSAIGGGSPAVRIETYTITGKITGAVCEFELYVAQKSETSLWTKLLGTPDKKGFIVFAGDGEHATYAEVSDNKLGTRKKLRKRQPLLPAAPADK